MMKNLVKILLVIAVVVATGFNYTKANSFRDPNYQTVINSFINSYKTNNYKIMKNLFSPDAVYKYKKGAEMVTHSAADLLKFVKENEGLVFQNFTAKPEIISQSDAMIMVKIILYQGQANEFVQYITLEKNKAEWKITQLLCTYENTPFEKILANK